MPDLQIRIGGDDLASIRDGATVGLVSGTAQLSKYAKITGEYKEGTTITLGEDEVGPQEESRLITQALEYYFNQTYTNKTEKKGAKQTFVALLKKLLTALKNSDKYELSKIIALLKEMGITLTQLAELASGAEEEDQLLTLLLTKLGLDSSQFENAVISALEEISIKNLSTTPKDQIEANAAYIALKDTPEDELTPENQDWIHAAKTRLEELNAPAPEPVDAGVVDTLLQDLTEGRPQAIDAVSEHRDALAQRLTANQRIITVGTSAYLVERTGDGRWEVMGSGGNKTVEMTNKGMVMYEKLVGKPKKKVGEATLLVDGAWKYFQQMGLEENGYQSYQQIWADQKITQEEWMDIDLDGDGIADTTQASYNWFSLGGAVANFGDSEITLGDIETAFSTQIEQITRGWSKAAKKAVMKRYMTANGFIRLNDVQAARIIMGSNVSISAEALVSMVGRDLDPVVADISQQTARTILVDMGVISAPDAELTSIDLGAPEVQEFVAKMALLAHLSPEEFTVGQAFAGYQVHTSNIEDAYALEVSAGNTVAWLVGAPVRANGSGTANLGSLTAGTGTASTGRRATSGEERIFVQERYLRTTDKGERHLGRSKGERMRKELERLQGQAQGISHGDKKATKELWQAYVAFCDNYSIRESELMQLLPRLIGAFKNAELYGNAAIIAQAMGQDAEKELAKIAAECLESRDQDIREKAIQILELIDSDYIFNDDEERRLLGSFAGLHIEIPRDGLSISELITLAEKEVGKQANIWFLQRDHVRLNQEQRRDDIQGLAERITLKSSEEEAVGALVDLQAIIDSPKTDDYNKAYAHYVRGLLIYGIARNYRADEEIQFGDTTISGQEAYEEAMYELRTSWQLCEGHMREGENYQYLMEDTFDRMVDIVDSVKHLSRSKKGSKRAWQLAGFVPNTEYGDNLTSVAFTSDRKKSMGRTPKKYRATIKWDDAKPRERYDGYSPRLTSAHAAPTSGTSHSGGRGSGIISEPIAPVTIVSTAPTPTADEVNRRAQALYLGDITTDLTNWMSRTWPTLTPQDRLAYLETAVGIEEYNEIIGGAMVLTTSGLRWQDYNFSEQWQIIMNSESNLEENAIAAFSADKDEQITFYSRVWQELNESTRETYRDRARSGMAGTIAAADEDSARSNNGVAAAEPARGESSGNAARLAVSGKLPPPPTER